MFYQTNFSERGEPGPRAPSRWGRTRPVPSGNPRCRLPGSRQHKLKGEEAEWGSTSQSSPGANAALVINVWDLKQENPSSLKPSCRSQGQAGWLVSSWGYPGRVQLSLNTACFQSSFINSLEFTLISFFRVNLECIWSISAIKHSKSHLF